MVYSNKGSSRLTSNTVISTKYMLFSPFPKKDLFKLCLLSNFHPYNSIIFGQLPTKNPLQRKTEKPVIDYTDDIT